MKWIAFVACLALCVGATASKAEDAKSAIGPQAVNITGTWAIIAMTNGGWATGVDSHGQSPKSCTFQQTGDQLSGTCKTVFGQGPLTGSVKGRKIEWRWLYKAGGVRDEGNYDFKVAVFDATLLSDNRLEGGFLTHGTYDRFHPSFEYKTSFLYWRPRYFTADKQAQG